MGQCVIGTIFRNSIDNKLDAPFPCSQTRKATNPCAIVYEGMVLVSSSSLAILFYFLLFQGRFSLATENKLSWTPHDKNHLLLGENPHDLFGWSVAISKDSSTIAVGAIDNDTNGSAAGQVRVFRRDNLQEIGAIHGDTEGDYLGYSVSLSYRGKTLAIGAAGTEGKVKVYEFTNEESGWIQLGSTIQLEQITTSQSSPGLGHVVALTEDGKTLVAGAPYYNNKRGMVLVFQYVSDTKEWKESGILLGDAEGSQFGYSVAIANNILAVGAKNHGVSKQGQVQIFELMDSFWKPATEPIYGENPNDYFGFSLSLSLEGRILAVGSPYASTSTGRNAGFVKVYQLIQDKASVCTSEKCPAHSISVELLGQVLVGATAGDLFGYSVSLSSSGHLLAVGARQVRGLMGQVTLFELEHSSDKWEPKDRPIHGEAKTDQSGFSVALSGNEGEMLVIGSPYHDDLTSTDKKANVGQVRVYSKRVASAV